jgi:hypothetical protein
MESLPKLDTSTRETFSNSARNSYASTVDSHPPSARSSYTLNSNTIPTSSWSSYSSLQDSFGRVSSFSRTSYEFSPNSVTSIPISSRCVDLLSLILCITDKPGPCENFFQSLLKTNRMKVMEPLPKMDYQLSKGSRMYGILCAELSELSIDITYPGRIMMANSIKVCLFGIFLIVDGNANMFCQHRKPKTAKMFA